MKYTEYIVPIGEEAKTYDEIFIGVIRLNKELIRCKDCKWWREDSDHTCHEHSLVSPMGANEFCSRGERKEHENT